MKGGKEEGRGWASGREGWMERCTTGKEGGGELVLELELEHVMRCAHCLPRNRSHGCCLDFVPCQGLLLPLFGSQNGISYGFLQCDCMSTNRTFLNQLPCWVVTRAKAIFSSAAPSFKRQKRWPSLRVNFANIASIRRETTSTAPLVPSVSSPSSATWEDNEDPVASSLPKHRRRPFGTLRPFRPCLA